MKEEQIETKLIEYLTSSLAADASLDLELDRETPLLDLGILDSMAIVDLMRHLEVEFGVSVSESEIIADHFRSVAAVASLVSSKHLGSTSAAQRSAAAATL